MGSNPSLFAYNNDVADTFVVWLNYLSVIRKGGIFMNYEHKMLLYKMYKRNKSLGILPKNFNEEIGAIDVSELERDMKIYVKR